MEAAERWAKEHPDEGVAGYFDTFGVLSARWYRKKRQIKKNTGSASPEKPPGRPRMIPEGSKHGIVD